MEEWKEYPLNKDYLVSTKGRVMGWYRGHKKRRLLKLDTSGSAGYGSYHITINGRTVNKMAHKMVAETFIPNMYGLCDVNHIDENKLNNDVSNLEWVSHKYNCNYGTKNYRSSEAHKRRWKEFYTVKAFMAKLTPEEIEEIMRR